MKDVKQDTVNKVRVQNAVIKGGAEDTKRETRDVKNKTQDTVAAKPVSAESSHAPKPSLLEQKLVGLHGLGPKESEQEESGTPHGEKRRPESGVDPYREPIE